MMKNVIHGEKRCSRNNFYKTNSFDKKDRAFIRVRKVLVLNMK